MAYTYKVNEKKHYILVQDANAVDIYPTSKFKEDLTGFLKICEQGTPIADFMTNTLMVDANKHDEFVMLKAQLCGQVKLMAKLKAEGHPVIYPDYNYFNEKFDEISKIITSKNLSGTEADRYRDPFVAEFRECMETVIEVNKETALKYHYTIEPEKPIDKNKS